MHSAHKRKKGNNHQTLLKDFAFPDVVALVHLHLSPFLLPQDALNLLRSCSNFLKQDVRDSIATKALLFYYRQDSVHFKKKCQDDVHQLIPQCARGARGPCACNWSMRKSADIVPSTLALPRMLNARTYLLETMLLMYKGIRPHCFKVLQLFRGLTFSAATMQPVVFALAEALEKERRECGGAVSDPGSIDTDDVEQLTRLVDSLQPGFGSTFFGATDQADPDDVIEAHLRAIEVDKSSGATTCQFCQQYEQSALFVRVDGVLPKLNDAMMLAHCSAVYQSLKRFMLTHFKHVRYIRTLPEWNEDSELHGLLAGFSSSGVFCGVYVTDIEIPPRLIEDRLAPGYFTGGVNE